ncbi:hypothetical protein [Leptothrix discophora]|uniref:Uncharacterized protein n=1 Tax=Leptothrix discophora TaxID=89 RepID=A0ABT9G0H8_LEPDI|nr:hypothetical protein [Leptothrix discophora]MDP4299984.1 hypothetical protein [Leptothrix discophora]
MPVAHWAQGRRVGLMCLARLLRLMCLARPMSWMSAMFRVLSSLLFASPLARAATPETGSNCLALLGGRLDARWGIPLAIVAGALVAWGLVVVVRRLLKG